MSSVVLKRPRDTSTNSDTSTIHLRCVGFCGADDSVEPALLSAISLQHNWVEWGVLFRPEKAGLPRFASEMWLAQLATANVERTMRLAGHLCSTRVDELLRGDTEFVHRMHQELGFTRFQINATAANGCDTSLFSTDAAAAETVTRLRAAFATLPHIEFIVQRNENTRALWERLLEEPPPNMSVLFDDSMGLGVSATSWPYAAPLASSQLARSRHGRQLSLAHTLSHVRIARTHFPLQVATTARAAVRLCRWPLAHEPQGAAAQDGRNGPRPNTMGGHGVVPQDNSQRRYRCLRCQQGDGVRALRYRARPRAQGVSAPRGHKR